MDTGIGRGASAFLDAASARLGGDAVLTGARIGDAWRRATLPVPTQPLAVISFQHTDQVPPILALAAAHGTPLHPVSRGRNWGFGSRLPPSEAVVLDLSGLDKVLDLDMDNGTARVQPGVTFTALQDLLASKGLAWHLPSFGGPPDASVLANALERGEGSGRMGDRFGALWDLDVALTTGERFRTGHARLGCERLSGLHPRPAGPLVEGLFSQSAFGIVLSGQVALQPTPAYACMISAQIGGMDRLAPAISTLRRLISSGLVDPHAVCLWDGAKRAASLPNGDPAQMAAVAEDWGASIALGAPHPDLIALTTKLAVSELEAVSQGVHAQSDRNATGQRQASMMTGFSNGLNVLSAYAGMAQRPSAPGNPDLDGCGFLWLCPAAPFDAQAIERIGILVRGAAKDTHLRPAVGFQAISVRAVHGYVSLAWDRTTPGADAEAVEAHDALSRAFLNEGFAPYRFGLKDPSPETSDDWSQVVRRIGATLDPAGIVSPGRLFRV